MSLISSKSKLFGWEFSLVVEPVKIEAVGRIPVLKKKKKWEKEEEEEDQGEEVKEEGEGGGEAEGVKYFASEQKMCSKRLYSVLEAKAG